MSMYTLHFDGSTAGKRPQTSKYCGAGWALYRDNKQCAHGISRIKKCSSTVAEYTGLIDGLAYYVLNDLCDHALSIKSSILNDDFIWWRYI